PSLHSSDGGHHERNSGCVTFLLAHHHEDHVPLCAQELDDLETRVGRDEVALSTHRPDDLLPVVPPYPPHHAPGRIPVNTLGLAPVPGAPGHVTGVPRHVKTPTTSQQNVSRWAPTRPRSAFAAIAAGYLVMSTGAFVLQSPRLTRSGRVSPVYGRSVHEQAMIAKLTQRSLPGALYRTLSTVRSTTRFFERKRTMFPTWSVSSQCVTDG